MKKQRGIWMAVLTVILSVAMLMGTMTVSAFAAAGTGATTNVTDNVTFVSQLEYGVETDAFAAADKIVEPNGNEVTALAKYTPYQIGAYTVYYGDYSYVVPCKLDKDYELRVDNNGADIATYLAKDGTLKLPNASVWVESDKPGVEYEEVDYAKTGIKVYVKVVGLGGADMDARKEGGNTVVLPSAQAYNVHYYAKVGGEKGTKYLYKDYTVKVQDDFTDSTAPTLSIVNIPQEISLNTKVDLPKGTATDNYDQNVRVDIKVEYYDKEADKYVEVKEVEIDENDGYAKVKADAKAVVFDNDYNRSFYPTELTTYRITYSAVDDAGNTSTGVHSYTATAVDKTAPKLVEIDDYKIPTKWGLTSVSKANESGVATPIESRVITFPFPKYVDNSRGNVTVIFELKDTVNNQTVIRFPNIYDYTEAENGTITLGSNAKYTYDANRKSNGLYQGTDVEFTKEGLKIDLANYDAGEGKTKTGTYTVSYQARDSVPNITTKTYDITVEDAFTDTEKVDIKDITFDDYYLVTDVKQKITIPSLRVSDNDDSRVEVTYKLISGDNSITVDGGETAELQLLGTSKVPTLTVKYDDKEDKVLALDAAKGLRYEITAKDDAGNESKKELAEADAITVKANLTAPAAIGTFAFGPDVPTTANADYEAYELEQGANANIGGFTWTVAKADREFYGFELSLVAKGKLVTSSNISYTTYYDGTTVHVEDIHIAVPAADEHGVDLYIRVFNAAGVSLTKKVNFGVKGVAEGDKTTNSAVNIPTTGDVYATYTLQNKSFSTPSDINTSRNYGVRKITGQGKFSLMGNQFVTYNAGTFKFVDGYYDKDDEFVTHKKNGEYTLVVTESATPVWQLQGEMPSYSPISTTDTKQYIKLPKVVASTDYANARIELSVTDPDGTSLSVAPSLEESKTNASKYKVNFGTGDDAAYGYVFEATKDGTYTVSYTAYYGDNSKLSETYSIKAGDVVAPSFTVDAHNAHATENSTFTFNEIKLTSSDDISNKSSVKYKKTLKAPDGSEVYTVEGTGETYRTMTKPNDSDAYKFTKTGIYTVEYTTYDKVGNSSVKSFTITVTAAKVNNPISTKIISTILIIVGVLLIAGVILYFVRFRKVKSK